MNTTYDFNKTISDAAEQDGIAYVRAVAVSDLPKDVRDQVPGTDHLYALHAPNGDRLALVKDRWMAFALARDNDISAVSVH